MSGVTSEAEKPHMPVHTYEQANASKPGGEEEVSLKTVRLSPYIRGGAQAEQCVLSWGRD